MRLQLFALAVLVGMGVASVLAAQAAVRDQYAAAVLWLIPVAAGSLIARRARRARKSASGYVERDALLWLIQNRIDGEIAARDDSERAAGSEWAKHNYAASVLAELMQDITGPQAEPIEERTSA